MEYKVWQEPCKQEHKAMQEPAHWEALFAWEEKERTTYMKLEEELYELADLFKVFGDSTRLRILYALFEQDEYSVFGLSDALQMTQSAISHQLKVLKQARLVKSRREGKQIFYSLDDDHVRTIISMGREHIEE